MNKKTANEVKRILINALENKLEKYSAETEYKPFFEAMFSKEAIATASILQSCYTSFGMSVYEQIAVALARGNGWQAERQHLLLGTIDRETEHLIHTVCNSAKISNKNQVIEEIRKTVKKGKSAKDKESVVDCFIKRADGTEFYCDITTVKPNLKEFRSMRVKLLRWCALRFSQDPTVKIQTRIGIPYNPYHPAPYARWTSQECDAPNDILVQEDLWNAFAGENVYKDLISIFDEVGKEYRLKLKALIERS